MVITILGAGSWGLALASLFSRVAAVNVWGRDAQRMLKFADKRISPEYLPPQVCFGFNVTFTADLEMALSGCDLVIIAVPVSALRETLLKLKQCVKNQSDLPDLMWVCKGFERGGAKLPSQIVDEIFEGEVWCGALLGPSFADEVALGKPTLVTLASAKSEFTFKWINRLQELSSLRIYANHDIIGSQVGAGVKNVFAIAAGVADGLDLGYNARAALITRALAEMGRLVVALGGKLETIYGLSGVGDLILTCTGDLSRNRRVGIEISKGKMLAQILDELGHVAEGVYATEEVYNLSLKYDIYMPLVASVYQALRGDRGIREIISELLNKEPKVENH